jgi:serine/threonine protein kinase
LKLENIIVTSKTILETVILDFGFAERINPNHLQNKAGTPGYIAPEVFEGKPYTEKGDVFSLGVMYYSMVNGKSPFKGKDFKEIME